MKIFGGQRFPIKRNENGRSARQRAFDLFSEGYRPAQVCKMLPISLRTACRYFEDHKKSRHRVSYSAIRKWMKGHPEFSEAVIDMLATSLEMSREEVIDRIQKPWGLLRAMKGEWPDYRLERQRTGLEERLLREPLYYRSYVLSSLFAGASLLLSIINSFNVSTTSRGSL